MILLTSTSQTGVMAIMTPKDTLHPSIYRRLDIDFRKMGTFWSLNTSLEVELPPSDFLDLVGHVGSAPLCELSNKTELVWTKGAFVQTAKIEIPELEAMFDEDEARFHHLIERLTRGVEGISKTARVSLTRDELSVSSSMVRNCDSMWRYTLVNHSPEPQTVKVFDWFKTTLWEPRLGLIDFHSSQGASIRDFRMDLVSTKIKHYRVSFVTQLSPGETLIVDLPVHKNIPEWTDYTFLVQAGFESSGPLLRYLDAEHQLEHVAHVQWSLLPLVDISAFFNIVAISFLGFLLVYNRVVKLGSRI
eukprot:Blabericola_migrator_1__3010@NODE_1873_length_3619_cov_106_362050_g1199_i0_p2_GENE_NODE_1873_length_3619_cov_106_362050_g1199_i0NODE_1873_length_3619_cov_106_362050_g1199_i0_p2_ORF_typecomplete_len303_score31_54Gpi16/PF04113_14/1_5e06SVM_signal/PF12113_8/0_24_NODE_1873_length_3619_cov_106_362050_g1199_i026403548